MLHTLVKVGNISNLSDARYCAGMGVEMLGFSFNTNSTHYVTPAQYQEIVKWLSGVSQVAECEGLEIEEIEGLSEKYTFDWVQVSGLTFAQVTHIQLPVIYKVLWQEDNTAEKFIAYFKPFQEKVAFFLIEIEAEISEKIWWELKILATDFKMLLDLSHNSQWVKQVTESRIAGIALRSMPEEKTGFTNTEMLAQVLEMLEV
ncbi:MAG: hypothetical protein H7Y04_08320 [Verrucomicrobia bacterium]|nr:hypothetical protein [Cytophagales bacterium]